MPPDSEICFLAKKMGETFGMVIRGDKSTLTVFFFGKGQRKLI